MAEHCHPAPRRYREVPTFAGPMAHCARSAKKVLIVGRRLVFGKSVRFCAQVPETLPALLRERSCYGFLLPPGQANRSRTRAATGGLSLAPACSRGFFAFWNLTVGEQRRMPLIEDGHLTSSGHRTGQPGYLRSSTWGYGSRFSGFCSAVRAKA